MAKGKYQEWLTDANLLLLEGWARDGLTDEEISDKIGIHRSTLYAWCNQYSAISDALKKGKAPVDYEVENALKNRATGYYVTVKKPIKVKTKKQLKDKGLIEEEHIEYVDEQIYIPPDTTAQIFWLKNRRPDKWRDKIMQQIETVSDSDDVTIKKMDEYFEQRRNSEFDIHESD